MRGLLITVGVLIVAFIGFLFLNASSSNDNKLDDGIAQSGISNFDKAPDFELKNLEGETVSLGNLNADVIVLNSWATWCPFCVDELPDFGALQREFGNQIIVVAINRQESRSESKIFTDRLGVTNELEWLIDPRDSFYKSIGGFSMPETLFLNRDKEIVIHKRGPMELDEMIEKVNTTLKTNAPIDN